MKRVSKRKKPFYAARSVEERVPQRCCICFEQHARQVLYKLSTAVEMPDGSSSCTMAEMIEEVAAIKLKQVAAQTICETCWEDVNAAYLIQKKIRRSKHLLSVDENNQQNDASQEQCDGAYSYATVANASTEIDVKFEVMLVDDSADKRLQSLTEEEYDCEYLDEYLEPNRSDDHTYDSRRDGDDKATRQDDPSGMSLSFDACILNEEVLHTEPLTLDHRTTRQFEMPRTMFVQRNELHDQYRTVEVTGERCCGCSFVAANRRELLQHSESVHAIEITGSGDYCPICFYKFATDKQLERHIQEFKSTMIYVCLQCNRFYNMRQKLYNHLQKCGESIGEALRNESGSEMEKSEDNIDVDDYAQDIEEVFDGAECDSQSPANDSLTEAYQRKMLHYRARFDEIVANEILSCELNEAELNVQDSQIVDQCSFDTFKYVRLRGERCCGCSFISFTRDQLMQHGKAYHAATGRQDEDEHTCIMCGSQFQEEREIVKHLSFFTSKELFFCTICNEAFLNKENLRQHQQQSEHHREHQLEKFQQAGIEMVGQATFVELDQPDIMEQLERMQAEKNNLRPKSLRLIPMPEPRFIKEMVEHNNYCVLTVVGQRCCGCGKFFDTPAELRQHSRQEHTLPLGTNWISDHLQCEICCSVFDFERGLALHRATRRCNKTILYLCKLCGLLFSKKFCLARHMQSAPNHLSQLIVDAGNSGRKDETDGDQAEMAEGEANGSAESDPRVSEALQLHKSVQKGGLEKVGHFVGYHCCFSKCTHTFTDEELLLEHSREEHSGKRRQNEGERQSEQNVCPCCCKSFQDLAKLAWHRFQRFVPRQHKCKHCDQTFDKWPKLKLHVETEHRAFPSNFVCTICNKSFVLNSRLKAHMKLHDAKKDFTCDVCGDKFSSNGLMKRHRRSVHSTELLFECKICPKRFAVIEKLQIHQRVHTGEKPFECTYCARAFSHYTDRKRHEMAAHTGERPHKCPFCPAAYVRNRELSLHMQKHKAESANQKRADL